jgi:hypothetical protein
MLLSCNMDRCVQNRSARLATCIQRNLNRNRFSGWTLIALAKFLDGVLQSVCSCGFLYFEMFKSLLGHATWVLWWQLPTQRHKTTHTKCLQICVRDLKGSFLIYTSNYSKKVKNGIVNIVLTFSSVGSINSYILYCTICNYVVNTLYHPHTTSIPVAVLSKMYDIWCIC